MRHINIAAPRFFVCANAKCSIPSEMFGASNLQLMTWNP